jgi:aminopeptidase N
MSGHSPIPQAVNTALILLLASLLAPPTHPDSGVDVVHYAFGLELTDASNEIRGRAGISVRFLRGEVHTLELDLVNASGEGGMEVDGVRLGGQELPFSHQDDRLVIELEHAPPSGEERTVTVQYHGVPRDGLIISENKFGERTFFGDNWPNRARHWLPTVDHPSDKATVEFLIRAPDHYQVVASGLLVEQTDLPDRVRLSHWKTTVPMATKVMVIGVARFAVQYVDEVGGVSIQSWVYPQDRDTGFRDYAVAGRVFRFLVDRIGPFPYLKLANVQSKTRYGGMENAGNIFYNERSADGSRSIEGLFAHEIAHQWFGDSVSEIDWPHIWLSEGFATYFTQLYLEFTYGPARLQEGMRASRENVLRFYDANPDSPLVNTHESDPNRLLNANSYQKGGWVLHMLRDKIGDAAFREGTQAYYRELRDSNASSDDFRRYMERASGRDLSDFFRQWVYETGQPELDLTWDWSDGQVELEITESNPTDFTVSLDVAFHFPDGSTRVERLAIDEPSERFSFQLDHKPDRVEPDPNVRLLMRISSTEQD